ncbi:MAG: hypothetical protein DRJ47_00995 [Thermoprotei archaeon]|nr:MAG: hypothetical protein DRJ47_00995 [Thermoprotei archaeon]
MKVFVLGIDGLEARLVKRWNLKNIMQREWGTHDVASVVGPEEKIYTPIIWASFLLGDSAVRFGYTWKQILDERMKVAYGPILYPLYRFKIFLFGKRKLGLRKYMVKLGLYKRDRVRREIWRIERLPEHIKQKTLVKEAKNLGYRVWIKEFPSYNDKEVAEMRAYMSIHFFETLDERLKYLEEVYSFSIKLLEEAIDEFDAYDLLLYYSPLIDFANHMLYRPGKLKLMVHLASYYKRIDRLVEKVSEKIGDSALMVISDHGYDPMEHEHSGYGFWSSNIILTKKPQSITDFKNIIMDLLKTDTAP